HRFDRHMSCVVSSLLSRLPPIPLTPALSTLFPYTTLFRSLHVAIRRRRRARQGARVGGLHPLCAARARPRGRAPRGGQARGARPDRKSTRLNSSHGSTSYAVFCLKKKKKKKNHL